MAGAREENMTVARDANDPNNSYTRPGAHPTSHKEHTSLSWLLCNTHKIQICDCEIDIRGALPHKLPRSSLKAGAEQGTGTDSEPVRPRRITTFNASARDAF